MREPPSWVLALFVALAWLARYASKYGLHLSRPPEWAGYFDQSRYIASALAFARGDLSPAEHWYPLAYPLFAAPFAWVIPQEPFFLPNLGLFVATALAFAAVMRRVGIGGSAATLFLLLGDFVVGKIARLWTEPWTTNLSAPLIWGLIAQTLAVVQLSANPTRPRRRALFALGLLAGALPLVRPADGSIGMLAIIFALAMLWRQRRLRPAALVWIVIGGLVLCVPYGLLHLAIYGFRATDYAREAADQGFFFADLPWKAYVVLITSAPWFPNAPSLVEKMPWFVPGVAGLGLGWRYGDGGARTALTLITLLAVPYVALALAYTDFQPPGLWGFANAHYLKWLFPLFAAGFWLWLRELGTRNGRLHALAALAIVLVPAAIRPMPRAAPEGTPARMLMFRGATDRNWNGAYFSPATITDARGGMINVDRFHQVPDDHGERALAVSRLFAGHEVRDDPGEAPRYRTAQIPYARYRVRLSPGIPCWLRRQLACRMPPPPPGA